MGYAVAFESGVKNVFGQIAAWLSPDAERLHDDALREVVEPHLAWLMHKRAKHLTPDSSGTSSPERWARELDDFVNRTFFWPPPEPVRGYGKSSRSDIAYRVDRIVTRAQNQESERAHLPATSRFGSGWAG